MDRTNRRSDGYRRRPPPKGHAAGDVRVPDEPDDDPDAGQDPDCPPNHDDCWDQLPIPERG